MTTTELVERCREALKGRAHHSRKTIAASRDDLLAALEDCLACPADLEQNRQEMIAGLKAAKGIRDVEVRANQLLAILTA